MNPGKENEKVQINFQKAVGSGQKFKKACVLTSFMVTLCEDDLTATNIMSLIEMGMTIIRFKIAHVTKNSKIRILEMIDEAVEINDIKNKGYTNPVAICIDIPNACIKTGSLREDINEMQIDIKTNSIIEITSNPRCWNKCDSKRIYIDDPYTMASVKPGTEILIHFGKIVMICTEVVNARTLKCKVVRGGPLRSLEFVCIRGVRHIKPPLTKIDLDLIEFAKEFKVDIVTVNSLRKAETLKRIRKMFTGADPPLLLSTICEQEGLDNIDEIIEVSDGIILAREFLACEILNKHKMKSIQLLVGTKCKRKGKPFFLSGQILDTTVKKEGTLIGCDLTDVTNAVLQGAGFLLRGYYNSIQNVMGTIKLITEIAKTVESLKAESIDYFWRVCEEMPCPVIASHASVLGCALMAKQMAATAIVVITVTGSTPVRISQLAPDIAILAVTKNLAVARKLHLYSGVIPLVYDKPKIGNWALEMEERIKFAIDYAIKFDIVKYGNNYVTIRKSTADSSYADNVSAFVVTTDGMRTTTCHMPAEIALLTKLQQVTMLAKGGQ